MIFKTLGDGKNPVVIFFHAMGVRGESSIPVTEHLMDDYYVILATSTVYGRGQKYLSKEDEVRQVVTFLNREVITSLEFLYAAERVSTGLMAGLSRRFSGVMMTQSSLIS